MGKRGEKTRVLLMRRKWWTVGVCALAAAVMFLAVHSPAAVGAYAAQRQLPIYCVEKDYKVASLSFDAAWGNEDTQQLIDILGKYNVKATFFVVGEWVDKYPESVKALHEAGHEIMNHSSDHAHFNSLSTDEIIADITACNEKIAAITGVTPNLFRPPYGEYDDHVVAAVRSMGMEPVQWDVDRPIHMYKRCGPRVSKNEISRNFSSSKKRTNKYAKSIQWGKRECATMHTLF